MFGSGLGSYDSNKSMGDYTQDELQMIRAFNPDIYEEMLEQERKRQEQLREEQRRQEIAKELEAMQESNLMNMTQVSAMQTIMQAQQTQTTYTSNPETPSLEFPNMNALQTGAPKTLKADDLSDNVLKNVLNDYPQYQGFIKSSGEDESEVINYIRSSLLNSNPTSENVGLLVGYALSERMELLSALHPENPEIREQYNSVRMDVFNQTNPEINGLKNILIKNYLDQGFSMDQAVSKATSEGISTVDTYLKQNQVLGTGSLSAAIKKSITEQMPNFPNSDAANGFISGVAAAFQAEKGFVNAMSNVPNAGNTSLTTNISNPNTSGVYLAGGVQPVHKEQLDNMIQSQADKLKTMMEVINNLPIAGEQKVALLKYLEYIADSIADIQEFNKNLSMMDALKSKLENLGRLESAKANYESAMERIKEALEKLAEARDLEKTFGIIGKVMDALNWAMLAIFIVIAILLTILLGPIGLIVGLILVASPATMVALKESGQMDKIAAGLMEISNQLCAMISGKDREDIPNWLGPVVLGCIIGVAIIVIAIVAIVIVVLMLVVSVLMFLMTILFGVIGVIFEILVTIVSMVISLVVAIAGSETGVLLVAGAIATVLSAIIGVIVALVTFVIDAVIAALQFVIMLAITFVLAAVFMFILMILMELLVACILGSGLLNMAVGSFGDKVGMSDYQQGQMTAGLTCVIGAGGLCGGAVVPDIYLDAQYVRHTDTINESQELYDMKKEQQKFDELQKMAYYANITYETAQNQLYAEGKDDYKEFQQMRENLNKLLALLHKMLKMLLGGGNTQQGGGPTDYQEITRQCTMEMQDFIKNNLSDVLPSGEWDKLNLMENLNATLPQTLSDFTSKLTPEYQRTLAEQLKGLEDDSGQLNQFPDLFKSLLAMEPTST